LEPVGLREAEGEERVAIHRELRGGGGGGSPAAGRGLYINDGDWVESCTAAVEHFDGRFEIIEWARVRDWSMVERRRLAPVEAEA
jgi:hypothetical protein